MRTIKRQTIESLPVCDDGKKAISKLLEEMGYSIELEKLEVEPKIGQVWQHKFSSAAYCLLVAASSKHHNASTVVWFSNSRYVDEKPLNTFLTANELRFVANSLDEYHDKKNSGEL